MSKMGLSPFFFGMRLCVPACNIKWHSRGQGSVTFSLLTINVILFIFIRAKNKTGLSFYRNCKRKASGRGNSPRPEAFSFGFDCAHGSDADLQFRDFSAALFAIARYASSRKAKFKTANIMRYPGMIPMPMFC